MSHRLTPLGYAAIQRSAIESVHYASIDVSLKELRLASRRVTVFSTPYHDELQVLERIYYKGKNQHRSALFWRKVVEIRRLGTRILEMNFVGFVEELRYAFYGTEDRNNPKALRGAWKQAPEGDSCLFLLKRLRSACLLVDQARARFRKAHRAYTQQIRTATFLPLAISLISITSRLDFLVSELREIIGMLWQAVARVLDIVAGPGASNCRDAQLPLDSLSFAALTPTSRPGATPKRAHRRARVTTDIPEDFGSIVPRETLSVPMACEQTSTEANLPLVHSGGLDMISSCISNISDIPLPSLHNVSYKASNITTISSHTRGALPAESLNLVQASPGDQERRTSDQGTAGKKQAVKKKVKRDRRRDEIDDIFGF